SVLPDPRRAQVHDEPARLVDDSRLEHLGNDLNDGRTTEALGVHFFDMRMPVRLADDLVTWFFCRGIDLHCLDGARRGAHAELDLGAFEGRSCGAGRGADFVPIAHEQLAVRADVNNQYVLVLVIGFLGNQHAYVIGADEARFDGEYMNVGRGIDFYPEVACLDGERALHSGNKWGASDVLGIEAEENVVHCRIENDRKVIDHSAGIRSVFLTSTTTRSM